jgi:cleavage and polyadenylation specificity factor subunit 4
MYSWTVSICVAWSVSTLTFVSPKPDLPAPHEYDPPSPPSPKDLGPPPPGYGRYTDFERGTTMQSAATSQGNQGGFTGGPRRNLDEVLCFKVKINCAKC